MNQSSNTPGKPEFDAANERFAEATVIAPLIAHARFNIGDRVRHNKFDVRGVVFDVDPVLSPPVLSASERSGEIDGPAPDPNQPFYHLLADNGEQSYVAYVSQESLEPDDAPEPIDHPAIPMLFETLADGVYRLEPQRWH